MELNAEEIIKVCSCGRKHTQTSWNKLRKLGYVGHSRLELGKRKVVEASAFELRNCECGSTISIAVTVELPNRYDRDGMRLTNCCGAHSTFTDDGLACKACYELVEFGEGDGNEYKQ